ncbi:DUF3558 domain-containing protein [Nocardia alni]|uniref:DUF3558 domain-containing protein n=1 Tax=Nocardia alni TaxID=2815723 RepID=UPI001C250B67|nr:DUF3558 domain-containing protein [Nocardia alni]
MITRLHLAQAAILAAVVLLVGACQPPDSSKTSAAVTTTTVPSVPMAFDPCTDIPQSVLDSLQWTSKDSAKNASGDIEWRGCSWVKSTEYGAVVYMTNATVGAVRAQNFLYAQGFVVDGRRAISTIQDPDHQSQQCTVDVAVKGGSLEIFLTNPEASDTPGSTDSSCRIARDAAQQIVPLLPQGL